jgi:tRNA threonylcarbamoyladenosine biosynthesis protein TsaB
MRAFLALDTATAVGSLALVADEAVLLEASFATQRGHDSALFTPLREALALMDGGVECVALVVGLGPGSYTGVRIGLSAMLGVSLTRQIPLLGLSSLIAVAGEERDYHVLGDARRGAFYWATVRDRQLTAEPRLVEGTTALETALEPGLPLVTFDVGSTALPPQCQTTTANAVALARAAMRLDPTTRATMASATPEPVYLRAPFITQAKRRSFES